MELGGFWPDPGAELAVLVAFFCLGLVTTWWVHRLCSPTDISDAHATVDYRLKLTEWERDRVMAAAKGVASSSAAFFVAILTLILKDEISTEVPAVIVLGCVLGSVAVLLVALELSIQASRFVRSRPQPTDTEMLQW